MQSCETATLDDVKRLKNNTKNGEIAYKVAHNPISENKHDKQIPGVTSTLLWPMKSMHTDRTPASFQQKTPKRPMPTSPFPRNDEKEVHSSSSNIQQMPFLKNIHVERKACSTFVACIQRLTQGIVINASTFSNLFPELVNKNKMMVEHFKGMKTDDRKENFYANDIIKKSIAADGLGDIELHESQFSQEVFESNTHQSVSILLNKTNDPVLSKKFHDIKPEKEKNHGVVDQSENDKTPINQRDQASRFFEVCANEEDKSDSEESDDDGLKHIWADMDFSLSCMNVRLNLYSTCYMLDCAF